MIWIFLYTNNKKRKTLCNICPKLTRKTPDQMCETKFLQIFLFINKQRIYNPSPTVYLPLKNNSQSSTQAKSKHFIAQSLS